MPGALRLWRSEKTPGSSEPCSIVTAPDSRTMSGAIAEPSTRVCQCLSDRLLLVGGRVPGSVLWYSSIWRAIFSFQVMARLLSGAVGTPKRLAGVSYGGRQGGPNVRPACLQLVLRITHS